MVVNYTHILLKTFLHSYWLERASESFCKWTPIRFNVFNSVADNTTSDDLHSSQVRTFGAHRGVK